MNVMKNAENACQENEFPAQNEGLVIFPLNSQQQHKTGHHNQSQQKKNCITRAGMSEQICKSKDIMSSLYYIMWEREKNLPYLNILIYTLELKPVSM